MFDSLKSLLRSRLLSDEDQVRSNAQNLKIIRETRNDDRILEIDFTPFSQVPNARPNQLFLNEAE